MNTTLSSSPSGDGLCSLGEAIDWSRGGSEPDCSKAAPSGTTTIDLPAGKYVVPQTLLLDGQLDIVGGGSGKTDIDGGGSYQVMYAYPGANVTITGVEISGGESGTASCSSICTSTEAGNDGGGIYNDGTLTLRDDLVTGNTTGHGIAGLQLCLTSCVGNPGGSGGNGGGIYNNTTGTLTLDDSTVSSNTTGAGGAGNDGVTVGPSAGENGGAGGYGGDGGGIDNAGGTLVITNSTISGNSTGAGGNGGSGSAATQPGTGGGNAGAGRDAGSGGGIYSTGSMTITGSTISANTTGNGSSPGSPGAGEGGTFGAGGAAGRAGVGGAILYQATGGQTATFSNDTLAGNSTGVAASGTNPANGGIAGAIGFQGVGSLTNVTIAGNSAAYAAGAIYVIPLGSTLTEQSSIIASNTAGQFGNCAGLPLTDGGHNIVYGDNSCPGTNADPKLQPLAGNGGPTQTMRLGAGSAAIDAVPDGACAVTTDQRGVSRPQGPGCDAGAYEVAPPQIASPAGAVTGPESAKVTALVDTNLTDTHVVFRYGTSSAYSTSVSSDLGAGSGAKPYLIMLNGLEPSTRYHFQLQATNVDGTTTSNDLTFTTPAAVSISPPAGAKAGAAVVFKLSCTSGGTACEGSLVLSSHVTTLGHKVVAVSAAAGHRTKKRPRRKTVNHVVGLGHYSLQSGQTATIRLSLNRYGKRLLRLLHRLPATLTASGAPGTPSKVTFVYRPPRRHKKR